MVDWEQASYNLKCGREVVQLWTMNCPQLTFGWTCFWHETTPAQQPDPLYQLISDDFDFSKFVTVASFSVDIIWLYPDGFVQNTYGKLIWIIKIIYKVS